MIIKKLSGILIASVGLLGSCEQELQLSTEGEAIPVVYAIINPDDSIHSIRISRSFKSNGVTSVLARNPDSICFDTLFPKIEFYTKTGWKYHEALFLPVENSSRQEGFFSNQGLQLYQYHSAFHNCFIQGTHLVLNIPMGSQDGNVTAIVEYVDPPKIMAPKQYLHTLFDFYPQALEVVFEDPPEFSRYELHIMVHIKNIMKNGDVDLQTIDKTFIRNSENDGRPRDYKQLSVLVSGDLILAQVKQDVKADKEVDFRLFDNIELVLRTGSPEFYTNIELNALSDDYGGRVISNITGGIGIFALKYQTRVTNIFLGPVTMDSLIHGRFTRSLNFRAW
jgi:hypothetical protein